MSTLFNKTRVKSTNFYFDQRCKVITLPSRESNHHLEEVIMKKINRANFKSFVKKQAPVLYIKQYSKFDGMIDGTSYNQSPVFEKVNSYVIQSYRDIVIRGDNGVLGMVFRDGNLFSEYNDGQFEGIEVYNCCGNFVVGVQLA